MSSIFPGLYRPQLIILRENSSLKSDKHDFTLDNLPLPVQSIEEYNDFKISLLNPVVKAIVVS